MTHFWLRSWRPRAQSWVARLFRPLSFASRAIWVSTLLALTSVSPQKRIMVFQTLEVTNFDFLTRLQPDQSPDDRILIVEVTEEDLSRYGWPLNDQRIAEVVTILQCYDPAIIGVDLYFNMPQPILNQDNSGSSDPIPHPSMPTAHFAGQDERDEFPLQRRGGGTHWTIDPGDVA